MTQDRGPEDLSWEDYELERMIRIEEEMAEYFPNISDFIKENA
jgi:hypothetical protein